MAEFRTRHPASACGLVGQNSTEVVEDGARGEIEAAPSRCPSTTRPRRPPVLREEVVYVSSDPERVREPVTIERVAAAP